MVRQIFARARPNSQMELLSALWLLTLIIWIRRRQQHPERIGESESKSQSLYLSGHMKEPPPDMWKQM